MNTLRCGCPGCQCEVDPNSIFNHDGEAYCSEACALQHPNAEPCPSPTCHCEHIGKVGERNISNSQLDEALEETFPASDPISP
ncbi:metallothionein [Pseudomonas sp. A-RE-19]|uniref:metallothionein n=1 Tax=Pseudomonas sp. A-RE-19 TaxID=2832401 RepID=UPI001CBDB876|nr:metallothionein [Pseudomonas sp. A-RE-19]